MSIPDTAVSQPFTAEQFRFGSEFAAADLERRYRESQLANNKIAARWCILAVIFGTTLFASSDFRLFGWGQQFNILLAVRVLSVALSLAAMILVQRVRSPRLFDAVLFLWGFLVCSGTVYVNSTRPGGYTGHIIITVELVLLTYCVLPIPLRLQIAIAALNTIAGPLLQSWAGSRDQEMTALAVLQSYLVANVLGIATALLLQRRKRQLFLAALRQAELKKELEQALAEIRTLRGILPICAHCKRVMNDAGYWEQVEEYVRKHTHAEFSHDICPECASRHFGDLGAR